MNVIFFFILSIYSIWDRLCQKTISRFCPFIVCPRYKYLIIYLKNYGNQKTLYLVLTKNALFRIGIHLWRYSIPVFLMADDCFDGKINALHCVKSNILSSFCSKSANLGCFVKARCLIKICIMCYSLLYT